MPCCTSHLLCPFTLLVFFAFAFSLSYRLSDKRKVFETEEKEGGCFTAVLCTFLLFYPTYTHHTCALSFLTSLSLHHTNRSIMAYTPISPLLRETKRINHGFDFIDLWGKSLIVRHYILCACVAQEAKTNAFKLLLSFLSFCLSPGCPSMPFFQLIYTNRQHERRLLSSHLFFLVVQL